jgi:hypothetical protein
VGAGGAPGQALVAAPGKRIPVPARPGGKAAQDGLGGRHAPEIRRSAVTGARREELSEEISALDRKREELAEEINEVLDECRGLYCELMQEYGGFDQDRANGTAVSLNRRQGLFYPADPPSSAKPRRRC